MKTKGFTLIELAVVLAIIAVLAAVLTPLVTGYLDQARIARAQADVRTISDALKLHQRDTGRYPIYATSGDYSGTIAGGSGNVIIGAGNSPSDLSEFGTAATLRLEAYINGNLTGVSTTNTFPKAAFRGPYVANIESDPWGNAYILTAQELGGSSTNHAFVISAGPNGTLETDPTQVQTGVLTVSPDDIVAVLK